MWNTTLDSPKRQTRDVRRIWEILLETLLVGVSTVFVYLYFPNSDLALPIGLVATLLSFLRLFFSKFLSQCFDFLYRWRWIIAFLLFGIGVVLQLHFSNVASFATRFTAEPSVEDSILFGVARTFRTDEYNVQLPYFFSQYYNGFQQISHQMSISGQDMIVGYNSPVLSPTLIGKPFVWGYILFGNAYGISWYFLSKTILMFMVSLELFYILTKSRHMAVFGSFLFTFAPANVWWFSPHFYDVIFWACALFVVGYYFFIKQGWMKWLFTILAISSLTGFTLALFPSLQVPLGVLMLALLIACLYRDREKLTWQFSNVLNVSCVVLGVAFILIPALWSMWEPLKLLLNTEYPGSRIRLGGEDRDQIWRLFFNIVGIFQPFGYPGILNNSEISSYTQFGFAFMLFYPYLWWYLRKEKQSQRYVGNVLFIFMILQLLFFFFEFPEWLARITLLSMCNRINTVFGVTATFFTIWSFWMIATQPIPKKGLVGFIVCLLYGAGSLYVTSSFLYPNYVELIRSLGSIFELWPAGVFYGLGIVFALGLWLTFTKWRQLFYCVLVCWTGVAGLLVNPIMQGTAAVTDYPLAKAVQEIVEENPDAWWLSLYADQVQGLLLANGAKVLNAVNFYPDLEKWKLLGFDNEEDFEKINRYAHFLVNLIDSGKSYVSSSNYDLIDLELNPEDFKTLDIQYVVGLRVNADLFTKLGIPYKVLFEDKTTQDVIYDVTVSLNQADNKEALKSLAQQKAQQEKEEAQEDQEENENMEEYDQDYVEVIPEYIPDYDYTDDYYEPIYY